MKKINILFLLAIFNFTNCAKFSPGPRILLPVFENLSVNFTLQIIEGGCFTWSSSRPDLISITPIYVDRYNDCSHQVVITAASSREQRRNTAVVLAEDLSAGETLRADVILDIIHELGVLTTTRELYTEEVPETFKMWAFDAQGNAFSTLDGVEFTWKISSQNHRNVDSKVRNSWQEVLKFLRFAESRHHEVPKGVEYLESIGKRGSMVLLEGVNTGSASVTVNLPYPEYSKIPPLVVNIMVLANLMLDPSDAHILVGDTIQFKIKQLKKGKLEEVPPNQYYLEIADNNYAKLEGNSATGYKIGTTSVYLRDRNIPNHLDSDMAPMPTAKLTITDAKQLTLTLLPYLNWVTVVEERHEIAADLLSSDGNKITLGTKFNIKTSFDETMFHSLSRTMNGTRIYGEAVQRGVSTVTANFQNLEATAELIIYDKIDLKPQLVIIPYDANSPKGQSIQFKATGGTNSFFWSSLHPQLVSIDGNGLGFTKPENLHTFINYQSDYQHDNVHKFGQIRVALAQNEKIAKTADIFFLPPVKLEIVQYNFETALNDVVEIHVAIYTKFNNSLVPFYACDNLNLKLDFSTEIFENENSQYDNRKLANKACRILSLRANTIGTTQLKVAYNFMNELLRDEVTLVVFEKLNILNPATNEIVLPIGATRNVIYAQGPQKMFNIEAELVKRIDYDKELVDVVEVQNEFSKDYHIFNVLCKVVGETKLTLDIHNLLSAKNYVPYSSKIVTNIYCVKPRFLNLYTTAELRTSCPMKTKKSLMYLQGNSNNLEIGIEVLDAQNRKLMNISSLEFDWKFAQADSHIDANVNHRRETEVDILTGVSIPVRDYLAVTIPNVSNISKIKGAVTSYSWRVLDSFGIDAENPEFGIQKTPTSAYKKPIIENELSLLTVNQKLLPFESVSIFIGNTEPERYAVSQGSGYYEITLSDEDIAAVEYDGSKNEIVIKPLRVGRVKVEISDRCLTTEPSSLFISVVTIGRIEVKVPDRVEKSKTIEAIVKLYDSMDNVMAVDANHLHIYELREEVFNSKILHVKLGHQENLNFGEIRYIVTGLELGETKIVIYSGKGDKLIRSPDVNVQVFPPLRLFPRNSTIIVGSNVQIYSQGGPHPDINILYSVQNENVISMESAVATALKLGDTKIIGKCVGINPATGRQIIFSQDSVHIYVVPLDKIKIKTPLVRIKSGAVMPATLWGVPDISPMILGTLPRLSVTWTTNQPDVVSIFGIFSETGIDYNTNDMISVRIKALNPGEAKIQAVVVTPTGTQTIFVQVTVFKMLELIAPIHIADKTTLIPPKASINLKANLVDVSYKVADASNAIVSVTKDGTLKTSDTLGRDLIIASSLDQTLSIPIEVKNIHYVLATLDAPSVKFKHTETKLPRGMNIFLKVTLHDNLGNEFSHNFEDINTLKHKLSSKEIADIHIGGNFTIGINLPREAAGMLAVSLRDTAGVKYAEDFIKLSVAQSHHIFPTQTIFSVGDIICFDSPLTYSANWISTDKAVIEVDNNSVAYNAIPTILCILSQTTNTKRKNEENLFFPCKISIKKFFCVS
ncbi:Nuclear pore membrane glycoprotein, partial [Pseudolycoriella hygida]